METRNVLDHVPEEVVDLVLPASEVSALHEVVGLLPPAAGRGVQLERPQEVAGVPGKGENGLNNDYIAGGINKDSS